MCITVKKILGSDMPKSQKCRAIYQKGVYVHGYNNSDIRPRSVQARKIRAWFRTETIPVDPWWGTDNGSDYLCHIMSQWISQGCPVIDISEFDEESQEAIVQGVAQAAVQPAPAATPSTEVVDYNGFTFGVEFECGFRAPSGWSGMSPDEQDLDNRRRRRKLANTMRAMGLHVVDELYDSVSLHADSRTDWKIAHDASLQCGDKFSMMMEIVSPILEGAAGWGQLEKACLAFEICGISTNKTCGTHVHIGVKDENATTLINVGVNYALAYKAYCKCVSKSRGDQMYCHALSDTAVRMLSACRTMTDVYRRVFTQTVGHSHYTHDRYYAVNYAAYHQRKTLEFRQHNGVVDFRKIQTWIKDKMELITWSRNHRLSGYTDDVDAMAWHSQDTRLNFLARVFRYGER